MAEAVLDLGKRGARCSSGLRRRQVPTCIFPLEALFQLIYAVEMKQDEV